MLRNYRSNLKILNGPQEIAEKNDSIVVFGGTFDPVHNGHIAVARHLRDNLRPDVVLMVPAGCPWLRNEPPLASAQTRLNLVKLGIHDEPGIQASDIDIQRKTVTYSIDTICALRDLYGWSRDFILAIGADSAINLTKWHRYVELFKICRLAVIARPDTTLPPNVVLPKNTIELVGPMIDISASYVRHAYATGQPDVARPLVPNLVHEEIIRKDLYTRTST